MPMTDTLGQQIPYPVLTEKPNAQSAFQNLVDAVTPKLVMTFNSASVRGATILTPQAGMVTWLKDVERMEVFDGDGWVAFAVASTQWVDISLSSGYDDVDANNNFQGPAQYRVVNLSGETALMFRGGLHITYVGAGKSIPNPHEGGGRFNSSLLPSALWPAYRRTIPIACSASNSTTSTAKLDINPDGTLTIVGLNDTQDSPPWVSLNGAVCPL